MPDDFYMVKPEPVSFWPHPAMGTFAADHSKGHVGRIHFAPAIEEDENWVRFRAEVQKMLRPVLKSTAGQDVHLCKAQSEANWPCFASPDQIKGCEPCVYVNT